MSGPSPTRFSVLLVDDDEEDAFLTRELLAESTGTRFSVEWLADHELALAALIENRHDVCLMDFQLIGRTGLEVLRDASEAGSDVPAILLTGTGNRSVDLAAMELGVAEYLVKGETDALLLERAIRYAVKHKEDERRLRRYAKELEQARDQLTAKNARLELLDAQKNELMGMAAHDLRNPLGVVYGYSRVLASGIDQFPPEEVRDILGRICKSTSFMRSLIDDLLDLTAIEAGTLRLTTRPTDPADIARSNVALNQMLAGSKRIQIEITADDVLPLVDVDPDRFDQVLNNLLSNAVKYSEPDTAVRINVRGVGSEVWIEVHDEGRGIEPEFIETMFTPFAKQEATGTAGEKSTGLGLAIVQRIVEAHDGRIEVTSKLGEGSIFTVKLPAHRTGSTIPPPHPQANEKRDVR